MLPKKLLSWLDIKEDAEAQETNALFLKEPGSGVDSHVGRTWPYAPGFMQLSAYTPTEDLTWTGIFLHGTNSL